MSRDFRKLRVFQAADELLPRVYRSSAAFRPLKAIRSGATSPRSVFDGRKYRRRICATNDARIRHFIDIAAGSATDARYLTDVSRRLGYLPDEQGSDLVARYTQLSAQPHALLVSLSADPVPKP